MKYIDIHAHLDFPDFEADRAEVIADMKARGVGSINIGTTLDSSRASIKLAEENEHIWAIVGVHPVYAKESKLSDVDEMESLLTHPKCVGIGECGLDFFREANDGETKALQLSFFEKQIELAITHDKTLMIHCREAYPETLDVLRSYKNSHPDLRANFHFFTEPIDTARTILDLGFTVSFTGVVTFVKDYEDLVSFVPIDSMMIETDSPFVAPKSVRGRRNDPRNVIEIATKIAQIKQLEPDILAEAVRANTTRIFGI
jgi:TatD DNase family protein